MYKKRTYHQQSRGLLATSVLVFTMSSILAACGGAVPDPDGDGFIGEKDDCPNQPENFNDFEDDDGCPDVKPGDRDGDGIPDDEDECPTQPENINNFEDEDGCPDVNPVDPDGDGILGADDQCPTQPENVNNFEDEDGCPDVDPVDPDPDNDGIEDPDDQCPLEPETDNDFEDEDGCPDTKPPVDPDGDKIVGAADQCPNEPETFNNYQDEDGCPDTEPSVDPDGDEIFGEDDLCPFAPENFNGVEDEDGCPEDASADFCWIDSYGRGVGTVPYTCRPGEVKIGLLCYPKCQSGYNPELLMCTKPCPSGYTDDGVTCREDPIVISQVRYDLPAGTAPISCPSTRPVKIGGLCYPRCQSGYNRVGLSCEKPCPSGYTDDGLTCREDSIVISQVRYDLPAGTAPTSCPSTRPVKVGGLCVPRCQSGYNRVGLSCEKPCPFGYTDDGATCRLPDVIVPQQRYDLPAGTAPISSCPSSKPVKIGALCYPKCKSGHVRDGFSCEKPCPSGYIDDGLFCRKPFPLHIIPQTRYELSGGTSPTSSCPSSKPVKIGSLCYPQCQSGYNRKGFSCEKPCSSGYIDDGATCRKPGRIISQERYNLPAGTIPSSCPSTKPVKIGSLCYPRCQSGYNRVGLSCEKPCPSGYTDDGVTCRKPGKIVPQERYDLPTGAVPSSCPSTRPVKIGLLCYPECQSDHEREGLSCEKPCPSGYTDDGVTCRKPGKIISQESYPREPSLAVCASNLEEDEGLCYGACGNEFDGIGPVCWGSCPSEAPVECGAGCATSTSACSNAVISQVTSTVSLAANIAAIVLSYGGSVGDQYVTDLSTEAVDRVALESRIKDALRAEEPGIDEASLNESAKALIAAAADGEPMDWTRLDPIGITAVLKAFGHSVCADLFQ